jgi:sirohydrochlorin cobaltochelatase
VNPNVKTISEVPIILTAFGTTARAFATYRKMDAVFRSAFPRNPMHWAFSSRMVKHAVKKETAVDLKDPLEIMQMLADQGYGWAVAQSLHMICGHEFDRLTAGRDQPGLRLSMGLPLLTSPDDYVRTGQALSAFIPASGDEAVVLVGHGTDHPAWAVYPSFETILREIYGNRIFVGVVEGYPDLERTLGRIIRAGYHKVFMAPLMLVAGVHFQEDLTDSWKAAFEKAGIGVRLMESGMGDLDGITRIFCDHIQEALDVIPL